LNCQEDGDAVALEKPLIEPAQGDFVSDYASWADILEIPREAHEWMALTLLAAATDARVNIQYGGTTLTLDLWVLLLSGSGAGRNTLVDFARRLLDTAGLGPPAESRPERVNILEAAHDETTQFHGPLVREPNWGSGAAFYQYVAENPSGLFVFPEFSTLLTKFKDRQYAGMKQWLTDRYDNQNIPEAITYRVTGKESQTPPIVFSQAPRMVILATSSWDWFVSNLEAEDTTGGFVPRWVVVSLGGSGRLRPFPQEADQTRIPALVESLRRVQQIEGTACLSREARQRYSEWYIRIHKRFAEQTNRAQAEAFFRRLRTHVMKLAVLYELSESLSLEVSDRAMSRSISKAIRLMDTVFELLPTGLSREGSEVDKIEKMVRDRGPAGISRHDLTRALQHVKRRDREDRIATLEEAGAMRPFRRPTPGRSSKVYVHREHMQEHARQYPNDEEPDKDEKKS
jgi:hypothetical protein